MDDLAVWTAACELSSAVDRLYEQVADNPEGALRNARIIRESETRLSVLLETLKVRNAA